MTALVCMMQEDTTAEQEEELYRRYTSIVLHDIARRLYAPNEYSRTTFGELLDDLRGKHTDETADSIIGGLINKL